MTVFERVLVAVGDTSRDAELIRYAKTVRDLLPTASFSFVHVLGWSGNTREEPTTHEQALRQLEEAVTGQFGRDDRTECAVIHGSLIDRLLETAVETAADVILVGHAVEHSARRATARRLAMKAPCSVWMRPEGSAMEVRRVLAAVDFSEPSAYALAMAGQLAKRAGSTECLALHVYLDPALTGVEEYWESVREDQQRAFERFTAPVDTAGIPVRSMLEEAPNVAVAVERVAESSGADLVVMGSRGRTRSVSILLGSESEHMLMEAKIPVLIVKRRGERMGLLQALLDRSFHLPDPPRFG